MCDSVKKQKLNWADMASDSEEENYINAVPDITGDPNEKFIEKQKELEETIDCNKEHWENEVLVDRPENLNSLYVQRQNYYNNGSQLNSSQLNSSQRDSDEWSVVKKKKNAKCYTCYPRKKVLEHIIQKDEHVSFHHDLCNRNIIVVTPMKHFSSIDKASDFIICKMFRYIHKFCYDWGISDYSVSYSQGEWQNHEHFHLKIKTHETIIKRMRNSHWRRQKMLKERNAV